VSRLLLLVRGPDLFPPLALHHLGLNMRVERKRGGQRREGRGWGGGAEQAEREEKARKIQKGKKIGRTKRNNERGEPRKGR
jgi:hypothetical protein